MKRLLRSLLLGAILSALLCVGALAADTNDPGIYKVDIKNANTTITPRTADGGTIAANNGYYANAVKFDVTASGLTGKENAQCLLLVLKGDASGNAPTTPTAENIVYINQAEKDADGKASFTDTDAAYPKELRTGTYYVYLVSEGKAFKAENYAAKFSYDQVWKIGDANGDGAVNVNDAIKILQCIVGNDQFVGNQEKAADADQNGTVNVNDAIKILMVIVGNDHFD